MNLQLFPPVDQATAKPLNEYLIVDCFAGGGGASTGIEMALGRSPDFAINHSGPALAMHLANHPNTTHLCRNIWKDDPLEVCGGRPVGLAWFSPDCKHFSRAKGSKPVKKEIRDLPWAIHMWVRRVRPRVIIMENVKEFQDWGPLIQNAKGDWVPDPKRLGETFEKWCKVFRKKKYRFEHRVIKCCHFNDPTIRERFFFIARCDGEPIIWPDAENAAPDHPDVIAGIKPRYRTAADCIDWSIPCPSIFDTAAEIKAKYGRRAKRPLEDPTLHRIARGVYREVLTKPKPFIVPVTHPGDARVHSVDDPFRTVTGANRGEFSIVSPSVVPLTHTKNGPMVHPIDEPLRTITTAKGGEFALVAPHVSMMRNSGKPHNGADKPFHTVTAGGACPALITPNLISTAHTSGRAARHGVFSAEDPMRTVKATNDFALVAPTLIQTGYGERNGQAPRSLDLNVPLGTVVAGGVKHALVTPFLKAYYGQGDGGADRSAPLQEPIRTVVTENRHALIMPHIMRDFGASTGHGVDEPIGTITAGGGGKAALVASFMAQHNTGVTCRPMEEPLSTITQRGTQQAVIAAHMLHLKGSTRRTSPVDVPLATICASGTHAALVAGLMIKYYGTAIAQSVEDPFHTVTTKDRFNLVTCSIEGHPYFIADIGMRMLTPRELFRAQGFPDSYIIDPIWNGKKLTKTQQIACAGNSVPPGTARALVAANCMFLAKEKVAA